MENTQVKKIRRTENNQQEDVKLEPLRTEEQEKEVALKRIKRTQDGRQEEVEMGYTSKEEDTKKKMNLRYQRDKDREKVRGQFVYYECPGGTLEFSTKFYKEDPLETWKLQDQEVYSLPRGVAKHLVKNGWYPIHKFIQLEKGDSVTKIGQKIRRFGFNSLEFFDGEDMTAVGTPLITAERSVPSLAY